MVLKVCEAGDSTLIFGSFLIHFRNDSWVTCGPKSEFLLPKSGLVIFPFSPIGRFWHLQSESFSHSCETSFCQFDLTERTSRRCCSEAKLVLTELDACRIDWTKSRICCSAWTSVLRILNFAIRSEPVETVKAIAAVGDEHVVPMLMTKMLSPKSQFSRKTEFAL